LRRFCLLTVQIDGVTQAGPYGFNDTPPAQGAASGLRGNQTMTVFALEVFGASFLKEERGTNIIRFAW
jgi:hypothetical protein